MIRSQGRNKETKRSAEELRHYAAQFPKYEPVNIIRRAGRKEGRKDEIGKLDMCINYYTIV